MVGRGLTIRPSYPAADVTLPPAGGGVRRGSDGGEVLGMRSLPGEVVLPRRVTTRAFGCATHVYPPLTPHVSFATPRSKNPLHAYLWRQTRGARTFDCSAECTCGTCFKTITLCGPIRWLSNAGPAAIPSVTSRSISTCSRGCTAQRGCFPRCIVLAGLVGELGG